MQSKYATVGESVAGCVAVFRPLGHIWYSKRCMAATRKVALILTLPFLLVAQVAVHRARPLHPPDKVWHSKAEKGLDRELALHPEAKYDIDPRKNYSLAELIDLAQRHNPETRVAWEEAKARAASLGVARSALFPTVAAVALAATIRQATLIGEFFHRQTLGVFEPTLHVEFWS